MAIKSSSVCALESEKLTKTKWIQYFGTPCISKHWFFGSAITSLKIIQTLQVGGVLESSGPPFDDGHRYFKIGATWDVKLTKKEVQFLLMPTVQ